MISFHNLKMFAQDHFVSTLDWKNTPTFQRLRQIFYPKYDLKTLVSFVNNVTTIDENIRLNRDEKRSGPLLIQWFRNNWDRIEPYFPNNEHNFHEEDQAEQEYSDPYEQYLRNNEYEGDDEDQFFDYQYYYCFEY